MKPATLFGRPLGGRLVPPEAPVLCKLPLAHGKHLATMPLGVRATLDADERRPVIGEPGARPVS